MKKTLLLFLVLCLAISSISSAVIVASDDTWVREDNPDSNRNGNDQVNARTNIGADDNDAIILKFDVTGVAASGNTLNLVWYRDDSGSSNTLSLYGLNETHADELTWAEDVVTYNTCPGLLPDDLDPMAEDGLGHDWDDIRDLDLANLTLLVDSQPYGPQVTGEVYTFSGAGLDDFINADTNGYVTFLILRSTSQTSSNQARFQVKEVGTGAYLDVVPEPATMLLLGLGGLVSLRKRR